ncbi:hypothetical protein LguiB_035305 [Lonicera macranthoides]
MTSSTIDMIYRQWIGVVIEMKQANVNSWTPNPLRHVTPCLSLLNQSHFITLPPHISTRSISTLTKLSLSLSLIHAQIKATEEMEGLIPFVYRAFMQYKNGEQGLMGSSPSASYMRLPGDSGRFQSSDIQFLRSDRGFSTCSSPSTATRRIVSTAVQSSPGYHFSSSHAIM